MAEPSGNVQDVSTSLDMTEPLLFTSGAQSRPKIGDEMLVFAFARCLVGLAKKR